MITTQRRRILTWDSARLTPNLTRMDFVQLPLLIINTHLIRGRHSFRFNKPKILIIFDNGSMARSMWLNERTPDRDRPSADNRQVYSANQEIVSCCGTDSSTIGLRPSWLTSIHFMYNLTPRSDSDLPSPPTGLLFPPHQFWTNILQVFTVSSLAPSFRTRNLLDSCCGRRRSEPSYV